MTPNIYSLLAVVSTLIFITCSIQSARESTTVIIPVKVDDFTSEPITIEEIILLETTDSSLFGQTSRIALIKDRIYILDRYYRYSLFLFEKKGRFIRKTGRGKGKGELLKPTDFHLDIANEEIWLFDLTGRKMNIFDLYLHHRSTEILDESLFFREFTKLKTGEWIVQYQGKLDKESKKDEPIYSFLQYSSDFKAITKTHLPDVETHSLQIVLNPISRETDEPLFCRPLDQHLYALDENGLMVEKYYLDFGKFSITEQDIAQGTGIFYHLLRKGERTNMLGDLINNSSYIGCSFAYRAKSEYIIYSVDRKAVTCSINNPHLPRGELKGMADEDTFILMVNPNDLMDFAEENDLQIEHLDRVQLDGNDVILLFRVG